MEMVRNNHSDLGLDEELGGAGEYWTIIHHLLEKEEEAPGEERDGDRKEGVSFLFRYSSDTMGKKQLSPSYS